MAFELRIILIVISVLVLAYILNKIRKSKLNVSDSIFWIVFALLLLILSIFPQIATFLSGLLGIETPLNFIFLFFIAIIILKQFLITIKISELAEKNKKLTQQLAFYEFEQRQENKKDE